MAFLTGSYAYGTPHNLSDYDIVIPNDDENLLRAFSEMLPSTDTGSGDDNDLSLIFCNFEGTITINLIVLPRPKYEAWKEATEYLVKQKPVTKEFAIQVIDKYEKLYGVNT